MVKPEPTQIHWRSLGIFLAIAFIPAWFLFLTPQLWGAREGLVEGLLISVSWGAAMWMPGLGALAAVRWGEKKPLTTLNLGKLGPARIYLWAWLIPILASLITGGFTWLFGLGKVDPSFSMLQAALAQSPQLAEIPLPLLVLGQVTAALTVAPLINLALALGEELGWRGYLLPALLPAGQLRAVGLSGVIWGIWHAPVILQGLNYPEHPVVGLGLMVLFCVLLGAFFSWLYFKTRSPWAPALSHGTVNAVAGLPLLFLSGVRLTWGGTLPSAVGLLVLALLTGILFLIRQLPVPEEKVSRETSRAGAEESF